MFVFKFDLEDYFKNNRYITSLVKYFREKNKLTRLKVSKDLDIPFTTYRRIEEDSNFKNSKYINLVADYFNINQNINDELITNLNYNLGLFFHSIIYGYRNIEQPYQNIIRLEEECKQSFLMIFINLTQIAYHVVMKDIKELNVIEDKLELISFMLDELKEKHQFLFYLFLSSYYALYLDSENVNKYHVQVISYLEKFPSLKAFTYCQITHNYILLEDWTNALFYALKAKDLLIETDNYYGLIYNRFHFAEIFFNIRNYDEAMNILNSLGAFLILHQNDLIPLESKVLHSSLYILLNKEKEILEIMNQDEDDSVELKIIRLYIYLLIDKKKFVELNEYISNLSLNDCQQKVYKLILALSNNDEFVVNRIFRELGNCHLNILKNLVKVIKLKVNYLGS